MAEQTNRPRGSGLYCVKGKDGKKMVVFVLRSRAYDITDPEIGLPWRSMRGSKWERLNGLRDS
jgi:hypothetical protein